MDPTHNYVTVCLHRCIVGISRGRRGWTYEGKTTAMEEFRVILREIDIPGAILLCSVLADNTIEKT